MTPAQRFMATMATARQRYQRWDEVMAPERISKIPVHPQIYERIWSSPVGHDIAYALGERPRDSEWLYALNRNDMMLALQIFERQIDRMLDGWSTHECGPLSYETLQWMESRGMRPD